MPSLSSGIKYGAEGASAGFSIGGPIGAAIGGGIGLLSGLFGGQDVEDIRERRFREYLDALRQEKKAAIEREQKRQSGLLQRGVAGAARRALATGDIANKEALILPAQSEIIKAGGQVVSNIADRFTQAELSARADFASRPIEPSTLDYIMESGRSLGQMLNMKRYIDAISKYSGGSTLEEDQSSNDDMSLFQEPTPTEEEQAEYNYYYKDLIG